MKKIISSLFLSIPLVLFGQKMYIMAGLEGGLLDSSYKNISPISDAIIDKDEKHYNIQASVGFLMEFENRLSATVGLAQSTRFWNLKGDKNQNSLRVTNRQNFASLYAGGYYQIPISSSEKINLYGGTKIGFDFVNYSALSKKSGVERDYVEVKTTDANTLGINLIPEIGIKGYFNSGNFWKISCRYNLPLNGDIVEGTIQHHLNNSVSETINYNSTGNYIAIGLTYGFLLD